MPPPRGRLSPPGRPQRDAGRPEAPTCPWAAGCPPGERGRAAGAGGARCAAGGRAAVPGLPLPPAPLQRAPTRGVPGEAHGPVAAPRRGRLYSCQADGEDLTLPTRLLPRPPPPAWRTLNPLRASGAPPGRPSCLLPAARPGSGAQGGRPPGSGAQGGLPGRPTEGPPARGLGRGLASACLCPQRGLGPGTPGQPRAPSTQGLTAPHHRWGDRGPEGTPGSGGTLAGATGVSREAEARAGGGAEEDAGGPLQGLQGRDRNGRSPLARWPR